jgi:general secretion pathway protein K
MIRARSGRRARRGVALIVVLWTVVLLATVTAIASGAARTSAAVASNARAQATARAMAESGIIAAQVLIDDSLRVLAASENLRADFLAKLEPAALNALPLLQDSLADGVFAVTVVDVSARLDVNNTDTDGLTRLFATATSPGEARAMAEQITAFVRGDRSNPQDERLHTRDSLQAALLGREMTLGRRRPFESLDELRELPGANEVVLAHVAHFLTVDGDGSINRQAAPPQVLASATGSLVDAPTRLLLIARGWHKGHPLTRQIEAVYDVASDGLRLVRWREHDR